MGSNSVRVGMPTSNVQLWHFSETKMASDSSWSRILTSIGAIGVRMRRQSLTQTPWGFCPFFYHFLSIKTTYKQHKAYEKYKQIKKQTWTDRGKKRNSIKREASVLHRRAFTELTLSKWKKVHFSWLRLQSCCWGPRLVEEMKNKREEEEIRVW